LCSKDPISSAASHAVVDAPATAAPSGSRPVPCSSGEIHGKSMEITGWKWMGIKLLFLTRIYYDLVGFMVI